MLLFYYITTTREPNGLSCCNKYSFKYSYFKLIVTPKV